MSYHVRRFMAFRANDGCYGDIHGIACSNVPILYTNMHIGMANNVAEESFYFLYTIFFFVFRVQKKGSFSEAPIKNASLVIQNGPTSNEIGRNFYKI